jgi:adenosylmethionine-8-amino-7-oxononanoate aminotransferase
VAAFIFEPLVLGAAGMVMYEPDALDTLITICKNDNVLTIADEVMTGFGKTGKFFASHYLKELPDMMCLSKALTGGAIPLAVTTFTENLYEAFFDDKMESAFFHGHTFTANPAGCAAAIASITLMEQDQTWVNITRIAANHIAFSKKIAAHPKVLCTRTRGIIFALEVVTCGPETYYGTLRNFLYQQFIDNGVILRPVGNTIYILPPFIITDSQLQKIYATIEQVLDRL